MANRNRAHANHESRFANFLHPASVLLSVRVRASCVVRRLKLPQLSLEEVLTSCFVIMIGGLFMGALI